MKAIVTGGAGFIGSHLCDALIKRGHEVVCYDNLLTGTLKNISHLMGNKNFEMVIGDVRNPHLLGKYMQGTDVVFNQMAAKKSICDKDPRKDCEINAGGTLNLLLTMVRHGVKKIVHASTGSVYGEFPGVLTEFSNTNPVSYYGVSKLAGEKYVAAFGDLHGIEYTILRYFHVYGERQDSSSYGGVIPIFIRQAMDGDKLTIHGDGKQVRSFTYVKDVVDANIAGYLQTDNRIYNCASGIKVSINDIAERIQCLVGRVGTVTMPPLMGDVRNFDINNQMIRHDYLINFTNFEDGLKKTVDYYVSL